MSRAKSAKVVVSRDREQEQLTRLQACSRCGWSACACRLMREHKPDCAYRQAILGPYPGGSPQECPHGLYGASCSECVPGCAGCAERKVA